MSVGPLVVEVLLTFVVAAVVLYRYSNWYRHHLVVTVSVLVAWYFSMLIVFILPLDVSNTIYENCLQDYEEKSASALLPSGGDGGGADNNTLMAMAADLTMEGVVGNSTFFNITNITTTTEPPPTVGCLKPWSFVPAGVFPVFWRVVYWTSQFLT